MTFEDAYRLSPELILGFFAILIVLLDLGVRRKGWLAALTLVGLGASAAWAAALTTGGWQGTALGDTLAVDNFSLFFKFLFLGAAALVVLASTGYSIRFARFQGEYYALVLTSAAGMMLMASGRELITLYISLELTSLSLYALAGFLKDPRSNEASLKYLLLGAISSAVLLYGMALLLGLTGETHLDAIANALGRMPGANYPVLFLGIIFIVTGFGFKIAAVPFQMWVPDVYEGSPTPVTAYLSVASKAAGFAITLRVFTLALGGPREAADWSLIFAILAVASMTLGNILAIPQANIKRMLGYSSIAQAGYLMVGLATLSDLGRSGIIFFLASYAFTNLGAFIAVIAISHRIDSDLISDYAGMAHRSPLLAGALTFCLISLVGIPPTAGFIAKVYLFNAAVQQGLAWLVIIAVVNSVISAYYYLGVVKAMFMGTPLSLERVTAVRPALAALAVATVGVLVVGILPEPLISIAQAVGRSLIP